MKDHVALPHSVAYLYILDVALGSNHIAGFSSEVSLSLKVSIIYYSIVQHGPNCRIRIIRETICPKKISVKDRTERPELVITE